MIYYTGYNKIYHPQVFSVFKQIGIQVEHFIVVRTQRINSRVLDAMLSHEEAR
jgi:hypothetical protein